MTINLHKQITVVSFQDQIFQCNIAKVQGSQKATHTYMYVCTYIEHDTYVGDIDIGR